MSLLKFAEKVSAQVAPFSYCCKIGLGRFEVTIQLVISGQRLPPLKHMVCFSVALHGHDSPPSSFALMKTRPGARTRQGRLETNSVPRSRFVFCPVLLKILIPTQNMLS